MRKSRKALALGAALLAIALGVLVSSALAKTSLSISNKGICCKFSTSRLTAKAGAVSIKFTNTTGGKLGHNFTIKGKGGTKIIKKGSAVLNVTLKKGSYKFLCTVPTHAANGMKGTLTVR